MRLLHLLWRLYKASGFLGLALIALALGLLSPHIAALPWSQILGGLALAVASVGSAGVLLWTVRRFRRRTTHGAARFATERELRRLRLFDGRGLILGRYASRYLRFDGEGHLLTFAPTRTGKGAGCVVPNLLTHPGSVVVNDIKGENFRVTARRRRAFGPVHALAPFEGAVDSSRFNPIDFIRIGTPEDVDDASLIADLLVVLGDHGDHFFDSEAQNLLTGMLLYVAHDMPPARRTLHQVWSLLMLDKSGFDEVIDSMRASDHAVVRKAAEGFQQKEERERSAVISTAQTHMKIWKSPRLAAVTSASDFTLEDLKRRPMSLYVVVPPELAHVYRPFLRVMIGLSVSAMTRVKRQPDARVLFMLDEVATLGRMAPLETGIGFLAGYGVSLWFFFQDLDQLEKTYPKWRSVVANCAVRQAFGVADIETARELSAMMGNRTVPTLGAGGSAPWPLTVLPDSVSWQRGETGRPLMAPEEIMTLRSDRQLIFVQASRPILAHKIRYYAERAFRGLYNH